MPGIPGIILLGIRFVSELTKSVMTYVWRFRGAKSKSLAGDPHMSSDCSVNHSVVVNHNSIAV